MHQKGQKKTTFTKKETKQQKVDIPMPAAETGRHTLTVVALNDNPVLLGQKIVFTYPSDRRHVEKHEIYRYEKEEELLEKKTDDDRGFKS